MDRNVILIADDMRVNRTILSKIFEEQYSIMEAKDGDETIETLKHHGDQIAILFLDLQMPGKTGLEVLQYMKEKLLLQKIPVIMITGESTEELDKLSYETGVTEIIYKPFDSDIVMRRAKNLIELFLYKNNLEDEIKEHKRKLEEQSRELEEKRNIIMKNNEFLINAFSTIIEAKRNEDGLHTYRIKYFSGILLEHCKVLYPEYHLTDQMITQILSASAVHDIGMVAVPGAIADKNGNWTEEELEIVKKHPIYGSEILEKIKHGDDQFYRFCYDICRYHHERYDGKGYPDGIAGEEIPIWSQIVGLADTFDELVSERVYRMPYASEEAARMIFAGECGVFSPKVLKCFDAARLQLFKATEDDFQFV